MIQYNQACVGGAKYYFVGGRRKALRVPYTINKSMLGDYGNDLICKPNPQILLYHLRLKRVYTSIVGKAQH